MRTTPLHFTVTFAALGAAFAAWLGLDSDDARSPATHTGDAVRAESPTDAPVESTLNFTPAPDRPDAWPTFEAMHSYHVGKFVAKEGFGLSRMIPLEEFWPITVDGSTYAIAGLELISLLKQEPVVYEGHPSLVKRGAPITTRTLDVFEAEAIARMRRGAAVAFVAEPLEASRLVGALRARDDCLRCHENRTKGDLLGAFTYELLPVDDGVQPDTDGESVDS